jgi:hypothetical protein
MTDEKLRTTSSLPLTQKYIENGRDEDGDP